jgi:hypothetical protein
MNKTTKNKFTKDQRKRLAERLALVRYRGGRKPGATNLKTRGKLP